MDDIINKNISNLTKTIIEQLSDESNRSNDKIEKIVQDNVMSFLKSSFEEIFKNQKTLRKREAMNLFGNKKEEKIKNERKTRKTKTKEQKQKIQLIPLSGDLKGFYMYVGTEILLIRNGNEKYSAIASYKNESVKSLSSEEIEFCHKNNIEIVDHTQFAL